MSRSIYLVRSHEPRLLCVCVDCGRNGTNVAYAGPVAILDNIQGYCTICFEKREKFYKENNRPLELTSCDQCWNLRVTEVYEDDVVRHEKCNLCGKCRDLWIQNGENMLLPIKPYDNGVMRVEAPWGPGIYVISESKQMNGEVEDW